MYIVSHKNPYVYYECCTHDGRKVIKLLSVAQAWKAFESGKYKYARIISGKIRDRAGWHRHEWLKENEDPK